MIAAIVLDLDGTLIDSREDIASALNFTLQYHRRPQLPAEQICSYVGDGSRELVRRGFKLSEDDPLLDAAHQTFSKRYEEHPVVATTTYPGVWSTLAGLDLPLAVCTNKPRAITKRVLVSLTLAHFFQLVVCGDDLGEKKPHARPLLHIAEKLQLSPQELLMVGDGWQDIECGRRAGATTAWVSYGIMQREQLRGAEPDHQLDEFAKLGPLVGRLRRS